MSPLPTLSLYNTPALLAMVGNLIVGLLVWSRRPKSRLFQLFALASASLALWNFGFFMMFGLPREAKEVAHFWNQILHLGLVFTPSLFLHLVFHLTRDVQRRGFSWMLVSWYLASLVFLMLSRMGLFVEDVVYYDYFGGFFFPQPGVGSRFFDFFFLITVVMGLWRLRGAWYRSPSIVEKQRYEWLIIAISVVVLSGVPNFLLLNGIRVYPLGHVINFVYVVLTAYAIARHRLLDVEIFLRKGLVYGVVYSLLLAVFFLSMVAGGYLITEVWGLRVGPFISSAVGALLAMLLFQPLLHWVQGAVDRAFFRERLQYERILRQVGWEMGRLLGHQEWTSLLEALAGLVTKYCSDFLHARFAVLCLHNPRRQVYEAVQCYPEEVAPPQWKEAAFGGDDPLFRHLALRREELIRHDLPSDLTFEEQQAIGKEMDALQAWMAIPIVAEENLLGALVVGRKKSEYPYNRSDVDTFVALAQEAAMALQNAMLFQNLAELSEYNRTVVETMPLGLCTVTANLEVRNWNTTLESLTGIPRQEALGALLGDLAMRHPLVREAVPLAMWVLQEGKPLEPISSELGSERGAGFRAFSLRATPLRSREGMEVLLVFEDITERQRLERELNEAQRLAYIGQLAANVAHEIKNILTGLQGGAQLLRRRVGQDEKSLQYVDMIMQSGLRTDELARALLSLARRTHVPSTESRRMALDLNEVIQEVLHMARASRDAKGVEIRFEPLYRVLLVAGDYNELHQVFLNLVLNGLQAMENRGTLTVRAYREGNEAVVEVKDTGCGIPPENLPRIFDRYFTTKPNGTGLGLATVKEIVAQHEGEIQVESQVGQGTTFTLRFPLQTGESAFLPEASLPSTTPLRAP